MFFRKRKADPFDVKAKHLYDGVTARARQPDWYLAGQVPDSVNGRFDMVVLMLSLLTVRLERIDTAASRRLIVQMHELFVEDMDISLRQVGIGDMVIGKNVGKAMSAFGGRLGAYRDAWNDRDAMRAALARNLYRGEEQPEALRWATERAVEEIARLNGMTEQELLP
jgi:cytochrome b pre-mRNA-processing protein 3|tara:strand:+ start:168526 stop:169026 length:501 start_codon:yes stop_codon:yes gene_type:complete